MIKFDKSKRWFYFYTLLIYINNFAFGIGINLFPATLVDLSFVYGTTLNIISSVNFSYCIGYMLGSLVNFMYKWMNRQLVLSVAVFVLAITIWCLPFYGHLWLVFLMMVFSNIGAGAWDSAVSLWIVEMWPLGHTAILQGNQFMYGLGSIVAPLIASPFVFGTKNVTQENAPITAKDRIQSLTIPYTITGISMSIVPILLLLTFFIVPYVKKTGTLTSKEPEKKSNGLDVTAIPFRRTKLALIGLSFAFYLAAEFGFITFSTSMYQYMDIQLTADQAARVTALLLTTYTFGRLLTAGISLKLPIDVIILYHFLIQLASLAFLYFGRNNLTMIYIGTFTLGYGFSALYPAFFAFTEQYLGLTERICSMYAFLVGGTCLLTPIILSQLFNRFPVILMLISSTFIVISCTLFISVRIWIYFSSKVTK